MRDDRKFDNYLRSELKDISSSVSPHIWENIVAERRKRKPVGFWINFFTLKNVVLLAGVFIAAAGSLLYFNKRNDNNLVADATATTTIITSTNSINTNMQQAADRPSQTQSNIAAIIKEENNNGGNKFVVAKKNLTETKLVKADGNIYPSNITEETAPMANTESNSDFVNEEKFAQKDQSNRLLFQSPLKISAVLSESFLQNRNSVNVKVPGCPTVEEAAAGNKKYFEVYAGPDFTLRNFKDTSQSVYLQQRKASTKVSFAYSAGIRYSRVFNNGMSIKAGLNYSQINEKFSFVQNNLIQVTYVIDPNTGDTAGSYTVSGTRKKTTYNKYRTIDIPILMGYELGNGRLHVNINAGAMINLYSWQKGEVLDKNLQPVSITTGKSLSSPYQFKNNVGVGLTGGVGFYYKLNDQLHILAEPYFRYNLKPMSKEVLTLQQKYNTMGIRFGMRLDLK